MRSTIIIAVIAVATAVSVYGIAIQDTQVGAPLFSDPNTSDTISQADSAPPQDADRMQPDVTSSDTISQADSVLPQDADRTSPDTVSSDTIQQADSVLPQDADHTSPDTASSDAISQADYDVILNAAAATDDVLISDHTSDSNNVFAVDFYRMISDGGENIFFSPISMYTAFSMLYEGAGGDTAAEIRDVFGLESDDVTRATETANMISSINRDDEYATLDLANAIWPASWFEPYESYTRVIKDVYLGEIEKVSFTDPPEEPQGVKRINDWAAENTNNKITKVITPDAVDDLTAMAITNAIYFKGTWLTQFSEDDTVESDFWLNDADSVRADFMRMQNMFDYTDTDGIQAIRMPYQGDRLSMMVILPHERGGIINLEASISAEKILQWSDMMRITDVMVKMPKFEMKTNYDLMPELKKLGMIDVFDEGRANLSGIADTTSGNLFVSSATHDAFVQVNEEGTEAAAVTTIIVATESAPSIPTFYADHPFIFIIQDDESGAILFMGRVSDPTA